MVKRYLNLDMLLGKTRSSFLFGPRGVGKTMLSLEFVKSKCNTFMVDLFNYEVFTRYLTLPGLFRKEIEHKLESGALTVFVDEIQKIPALLDEIHSLIEQNKTRIQFLMTGSSARKLKRGGANLLAGRAWTLNLHPLTDRECKIDLKRALQFGTLPAIYLQDEVPERTLKAYVETYLKEEIMQEAILRRIDKFIRFLDVAGQMNGEPVNFTKIARDCGVSTKTAIDFFSILTDTLLAFRIEGWTHSIRKQLCQSPKFYFFDCGVLNAINGELKSELKEGSYRFGKLFETFVVQELIRLNDYTESGYHFYYWRTNTGLEVDIILSKNYSEPPIAIEIKSSNSPTERDMHALKSFKSENKKAILYCICLCPKPYRLGNITVYPWRQAMEKIFPS